MPFAHHLSLRYIHTCKESSSSPFLRSVSGRGINVYSPLLLKLLKGTAAPLLFVVGHPGNRNKAGAFWAGGAESRGIPRGRGGREAPQAGPLSLPSTEEPRATSGGFRLLGMDLQHPGSSHTSTLAKWGPAERPLPQVGCHSRAPSLLCAERAQMPGLQRQRSPSMLRRCFSPFHSLLLCMSGSGPGPFPLCALRGSLLL